VPTQALADMVVFEPVARTPVGDLEFSVTMSRENFDILQRIINGDPRFQLAPVVQVDLLERAKIGDHEPLIRQLEEGGDLTEGERRVLGTLARGALPAPQNCPPKIETEVRARDVARFVSALKELGGKRATDIAAAKFDIDRSYVTKHCKTYGKREGVRAFLVKLLFLAGGADEPTALRAMQWFANVSDEDIREATQRKRRVNRK
jgi:hypothetical protein